MKTEVTKDRITKTFEKKEWKKFREVLIKRLMDCKTEDEFAKNYFTIVYYGFLGMNPKVKAFIFKKIMELESDE